VARADPCPGCGRVGEAGDSQVRTTRADEFANGVAVDIVHGPVTAAAMEYLRWTSVVETALNVVVLGLVALILAVALVPVEAARHRFGRHG
jgi:hypothetical protein